MRRETFKFNVTDLLIQWKNDGKKESLKTSIKENNSRLRHVRNGINTRLNKMKSSECTAFVSIYIVQLLSAGIGQNPGIQRIRIFMQIEN